jgi:outer membrane protein OmpA-like peptidoglycan-associated protein
VQYQGDTVIIDFELNRYRPGDYIIMYNVYFYQDATLMKPVSKPELNELLEMLNENEKLTVKIHGHTNGNAFGKIIEMSDEDTDYFRLRPTNKTGKGSAKKLSLKRAEILKRYLVDSGISEDRMEVKGWGGKRPIVGKFHGEAHTNVRVEIEILTDS